VIKAASLADAFSKLAADEADYSAASSAAAKAAADAAAKAADAAAKAAADAAAKAADATAKAADAAAKAADAAAKAAADAATNAARAAELAHQGLTSYLDGHLVTTTGCDITGLDSQGNPVYTFKKFGPLIGNGCNDAAVLAYYNVAKTTTFANQAQFFYNAAQSTNQVYADLLTTTFSGGVQVVLAGTATAGSSQPAGTSAGAAVPATSTDSVSTAVSKLEQGGDFNLRLAYPLAHFAGPKGGFTATFLPNLGFAVNGLSSQSTITESTDYSGSVPVEFYGEVGSIPSAGTAAVVYADAKIGGDFVSSDFASKIGTNSAFFLGQFSAGIEFAKSVRVGFQYFIGPKQAYCVPNTTGCTAVTGSLSGVHLIVSFTPPSK
jgi:hypothetical protein